MVVEELVHNEIILGEMYNFCDPRGTSMILGFGLGLYFICPVAEMYSLTQKRGPPSACAEI